MLVYPRENFFSMRINHRTKLIFRRLFQSAKPPLQSFAVPTPDVMFAVDIDARILIAQRITSAGHRKDSIQRNSS